jgi:LysR family transcriptional regulator of abg operon
VRLTQIRDVLAVFDCGGIRAAARKLGVSQPTITKSVRSLEAELHVQLFERNARGLAPTPSGRAFFARARVAHSELRKAEEEAAEAGGSSAGSVAFGISRVALVKIVPEAIARLRRQFPRTHVRVVEGPGSVLLPAVRDETLDFAVGLRPVGKLDRAFRFRPLYRSQLCVVARKGHPLAHARSLPELAGADWLGLPIAGSLIARLFASAGLPPPQPVVQYESMSTFVSLLATSDMLGVVQRLNVKEPPAREVLQEIPISGAIPSVTIGIFTRADTPLTRLAAAMVKHVTAVARDLARPG